MGCHCKVQKKIISLSVSTVFCLLISILCPALYYNNLFDNAQIHLSVHRASLTHTLSHTHTSGLDLSDRKTVSFNCTSHIVLLILGDRVLSCVLRKACCRWAVAEQQLPDDVRIERSINAFVVVDQGDELCS